MTDLQDATPIHIFASLGARGIFALTPDASGAALPSDGAGWEDTGEAEPFERIRRNTSSSRIDYMRQRGFLIVEDNSYRDLG